MNNAANEIIRQFGHKALFMVGGKVAVKTENSVRFSFMPNAKGVRHVEIRLDPSDTYTMTFTTLKGKVVAEIGDVYAENMHSVFEANTGLYTSM